MKTLNEDIIPEFILQKSNLSWDELELINHIHQHPEEYEKILKQLQSEETK